MIGSIKHVSDHRKLMSEINAVHAARAESVRALRAVQAEYTAADQARKRAARAVLDADTGYTHEQLADALGFRGRHGLLRLAGARHPSASDCVFTDNVLGELAELAERFERAVRERLALVRALRSAARDERLTYDQMGAAMGLSAEGVRYLVGDRRVKRGSA